MLCLGYQWAATETTEDMVMGDNRWLCRRCGVSRPVDRIWYLCDCPAAGRLDLRTTAGSRPDRARDDLAPGIWRYGDLLPLAATSPAAAATAGAFPAGETPLIRADRLAGELNIGELWIKDESANPTGSLKDRASAMVVAAARHHGVRTIATASSGNAGAALAGAAAAVGLPCVVFLPARASGQRRAQLIGYGARVLVVDGTYSDAVKLSVEACEEWGWFCRTSAINPYTTQGKKTVILEVLEQLRWSAPDVVVVPVGDGNILAAIHHGLRDAYELGWIHHMPRLIGVQAAGAPAVHRAWRSGASEVDPVGASTIADGISVDEPLDGHRALAAVRETGGLMTVVSEEAIVDAQRRLAARAGVYAEPSSAAAAAALPDLVSAGQIRFSERVVLINTGRGAGPAIPGTGAAEKISDGLPGVARAVPDLCRNDDSDLVLAGLSVIFGT
jgi:threonine synthase